MPERFNAAEWLVDRHLESGDGERVAVVTGGEVTTYNGLGDRVGGAAAGLQQLGVHAEQRVLIAAFDSLEFVATFLGAMRIGAIPLAANPLLPLPELAAIADLSAARVAVLSPGRADELASFDGGWPSTAQVLRTDALAWPEKAATPAYPTWDESPGFWLCTSGTTGRPKLAMHRHIDLKVTATTYAHDILHIDRGDRFYSVGPMFHAYGLGNSLTFPFSVAATTVLEPTRPPTPTLVANVVQREAPTLFFCIPTFYAALLASDVPDDTFKSVRSAVSAAEPLPADLYARFLDRFGVEILDGIGSTELTHIFISNRRGALRPGTSGVPVDGYDIRLLDDEGTAVGADVPGHLYVGGESMATGYWCNAEATRNAFHGPVMRTGDMYTRSGDGYFTYLGRSDDMLRVSGEWVSPAEVEAVLVEHEHVLEAAVVSGPDEDGIQRVVAHVVAVPEQALSPDELDAHCRTRLVGYKRPRRFVVHDTLPKTATGKIQRFRLRDEDSRTGLPHATT